MISNKIIDGKKLQTKIFLSLKKEIKNIEKTYQKKPVLCFINMGQNQASLLYIRIKEKACAELGIESKLIDLPSDTSTQKFLSLIDNLNNDSSINGILVQLPLPSSLETQKILEAIDPKKDVDGFHPYNVGKLWQSLDPYFFPCTPLGIYRLLKEYNFPLEGKNVVIVNRSNIVGKPLLGLLSQNLPFSNATVTLCHSKTRDLSSYLKKADCIISAVGQPHFITKDMIKEQVILIDVASNYITMPNSSQKLVGDIDFEGVFEKCGSITPVPGGVGPMTVAMLMENTVKAFYLQNENSNSEILSV